MTYKNEDVAEATWNWFTSQGAYVLTDGQYGSTGKGVIAAALAECHADRVNMVVSNAGPNSGHTSYFGDEKIVLKQLPTFGVTAMKMHLKNNVEGRVDVGQDKTYAGPGICLSAGAVIDKQLLDKELDQYFNRNHFMLHPYAAYIGVNDKIDDLHNVRQMASTGQGVGPALVNKMRRIPGAVVDAMSADDITTYRTVARDKMAKATVFFEVSQGYSLGINSGFYPHVTTRECTVSQALSDAGLPPSMFRKSILSVRTFPIRVGSTENSSGPCYPDQMETDWSKLGVEPELTTVTKRVRRVFTWSDQQFKEAVFANDPSVIFLNFLNYLKPGTERDFVWNRVIEPYVAVKGKLPQAVLMGYGPKSSDIKLFRH